MGCLVLNAKLGKDMKQPLLYGIVFSLLMPQCVDANEQNQNDQAKLNQAIKTEQQTIAKSAFE